jgi:hypothetical protein
VELNLLRQVALYPQRRAAAEHESMPADAEALERETGSMRIIRAWSVPVCAIAPPGPAVLSGEIHSSGFHCRRHFIDAANSRILTCLKAVYDVAVSLLFCRLRELQWQRSKTAQKPESEATARFDGDIMACLFSRQAMLRVSIASLNGRLGHLHSRR